MDDEVVRWVFLCGSSSTGVSAALPLGAERRTRKASRCDVRAPSIRLTKASWAFDAIAPTSTIKCAVILEHMADALVPIPQDEALSESFGVCDPQHISIEASDLHEKTTGLFLQ